MLLQTVPVFRRVSPQIIVSVNDLHEDWRQTLLFDPIYYTILFRKLWGLKISPRLIWKGT